jgi:GTP:adenosylcobinamide-phosphate guanylyltransferase
MCGGRGSRLDLNSGLPGSEDPIIEKALLELKQKPLIHYVINALEISNINLRIFAAISPKTKKTKEFIYKTYSSKVTILNTRGLGFSNDYKEVIQYFEIIHRKFDQEKQQTQLHNSSQPNKILFLPIDVPLMSKYTLKKILSIYQETPCVSIVIDKDLITRHGFTPTPYTTCINNHEYCYSGISLVDIPLLLNKTNGTFIEDKLEEKAVIVNDPKLAFNINTNEELNLVEEYLNKGYFEKKI